MLELIRQLLNILFGKRKQLTSPYGNYLPSFQVAKLPVIPEKPKGGDMNHHDYVTPRITIHNKTLWKQFLSENGNFENFHYRKGAAYTADFGIENGWGDNFAPGYVRIHHGVDRARGGSITTRGKTINDIVMSPMNFDSSDFIDYRDKGYGTLVLLISKKYQFDMRIGHMDPNKDFIPWSLQQFKLKKLFNQNWYIGSAGTYGYSTGAHTHTELVSHDESCEILELMMLDRFGEKIYKQYTDEEIVAFYRKQAVDYPKTSPYVDWTDGEILQDWINLKAKKNIFFINSFKSCFFWREKPYTKYSTNMVLKGL